MKTENRTLRKEELFTLDSATSLMNLIDNQIKQIEKDYLSEWEKDHSYSKADRDERIAKLEQKKEKLSSLFKQMNNSGKMVVNVDVEEMEEVI